MSERRDSGTDTETIAERQAEGSETPGNAYFWSVLVVVCLVVVILGVTHAVESPEILPPPQCLVAHDFLELAPDECR